MCPIAETESATPRATNSLFISSALCNTNTLRAWSYSPGKSQHCPQSWDPGAQNCPWQPLCSGSSAEINTCCALYEAPVLLLLILGVQGKDFHRREDGEHTIECEWHARSQHQCGKLPKSGCPSYNWMSVHSTPLKRSLWEEVTG